MTAWAGSNRASRLPPNWDSEIRPAVFARDGDICHLCGLPGATDVDHLTAGDDHSMDNLAPIHGQTSGLRCHQRKSSSEGGRAAAAKRNTRRPEEPHPGVIPRQEPS